MFASYSLDQLIRAAPPTPSHKAKVNWAALRLLTLYRLLLNFALLATFYYLGAEGATLGFRNPTLFSLANFSYLAAAALFILCLQLNWPRLETQVYLQVYIDIAAITLLMHASGGLASGLGMMLVVTIAISALTVMNRFAVLFAAIASLTILAEQIYTHLSYGSWQTSYVQAGTLGAALLATATVVMILARSNQEAEELANRQRTDIENLAELNQQIIQQMESGILFVDDQRMIRVANDSARLLLNISLASERTSLDSVSRPLATALDEWLKTPSLEQTPVLDRALDTEIQPYFLPMGKTGTLIRLEDSANLKQQLQQLKLVSLGRLTASIAHEIRNPLGAIAPHG